MTKDDNFFEKAGLEIGSASSEELEEGKTYPLFGCITSFISEDLDRGVVVEVNGNLILQMANIKDDKLDLLKSKAFESGIFVAKLVNRGDIKAGDNPIFECSTVVFGKSQSFEA
jgi:hypothetical protein